MPKTASEYINDIQHELRGDPDSRLDMLDVVNQAGRFLVNLHDWKFRKRPPLDVTFQAAGLPTVQTITAISRTSNVVTLTVVASPTVPFALTGWGSTVIVSGVTNTSFNGTFAVVSVISATQITYAQTGSDASSSGGLAGPFAYEQFIDLPADFGQLIDVCTKNNAIANIVMTSLPEIAWRRGSPNSVAYDGLYRAGMSFPGQSDIDSNQDVPRLEIWPRPTGSNSAGDLTLTYRAGWVEVTDGLDDTDDTVPNIPLYFERLLGLLVRLFAQGYEEGTMAEQPSVQTEVAMLLGADGGTQINMGLLQGGAVQRKRSIQLREFQRIVSPSNRL